jgi:flagellar motor switch protein FliN/FliY
MADEVTNSAEAVVENPPPDAAATASAPAAPESAAPTTAAPQPKPSARPSSPKQFPRYTRNLLTVKVPVSVTLAAKKQPLKQILELAPGSMIQFNKSCDEMLELYVGDQCIARGIAIKVGEKFGLRVNALTPPGERYQAVRPQS